MNTVRDRGQERDAEIKFLKERLNSMQSQQRSTMQSNVNSSESTNQLIALLKMQIDTLEKDKRDALKEDNAQNELIEKQQLDIQSLKKELKNRAMQFKSLQAQFTEIMSKLQQKTK